MVQIYWKVLTFVQGDLLRIPASKLIKIISHRFQVTSLTLFGDNSLGEEGSDLMNGL
jgi:hypothetical protein